MRIFEYGKEKTPIASPVIALGFFDGVHIAHRELLLRAKDIATEGGVPFGIFTFPAECGIKTGAKRLYSTGERLEIFKRLGADFTILADFREISPLTPKEFVKDVLIDGLGCRVAVAGFNYRFGRGASGNVEELTALMREYGGDAVIRKELTHRDRTVSASLIRELLSSGDIKYANELLGEPYHISGKVEHGNGVGRTLGFPTLNTDIPTERDNLKHGVYRTAIPIGDRIYVGLTNVGKCPTFGERAAHAETYIIDFSGDLYGKETTVYFLDYLREERRFDTPKELIMQINIDKTRAISENGVVTWQELGLK